MSLTGEGERMKRRQTQIGVTKIRGTSHCLTYKGNIAWRVFETFKTEANFILTYINIKFYIPTKLEKF